MDSLNDRARGPLLLRAVRSAGSKEDGRQLIAAALPAELASAFSTQQLEALRRKIAGLPVPKTRARLSQEDLLSALAIAILVFLSTFPVVIPFFFLHDTYTALRVSNAVAIAMLFVCGYSFALCIGSRPWPTGLVMVGVGCAFTGVAILLGG